MKYQYIFFSVIERLDKKGRPILDPETNEPVMYRYPMVLHYAARGKGRGAMILGYNDTNDQAAHLFNTKQQFKGYLNRTVNHFLQYHGSIPYWLDYTKIEAVKILRDHQIFEFNYVRKRHNVEKAKIMAQKLAADIVEHEKNDE